MITKENINVLITGCGAPGISGTIYSLKQKNDYINVRTFGTDINHDAVGKYFCDEFFIIPSFRDYDNYLDRLFKICQEKNINVIIPQNTLELNILSKNKALFNDINVMILVSDKYSIEIANNKYNLLMLAKKLKIPYPEFKLVGNLNDLETEIKNLGWPEKKIVIKPPLSNGSRGVRVIDESINLKDDYFMQKPGSLLINFELIQTILGKNFDEIIVMEYLPGDEYTVDYMESDDSDVIIPRIRKEIKNGITFFGITEKNPLIEQYSTILAKNLKLKYCFGFQYKMKDDKPYIIECNPRVQGSMVISTLANANIILSSVLKILNKPKIPIEIEYGTKFKRYWGGLSENNLGITKI